MARSGLSVMLSHLFPHTIQVRTPSDAPTSLPVTLWRGQDWALLRRPHPKAIAARGYVPRLRCSAALTHAPQFTRVAWSNCPTRRHCPALRRQSPPLELTCLLPAVAGSADQRSDLRCPAWLLLIDTIPRRGWIPDRFGNRSMTVALHSSRRLSTPRGWLRSAHGRDGPHGARPQAVVVRCCV
jgi:hypothetical protein